MRELTNNQLRICFESMKESVDIGDYDRAISLTCRMYQQSEATLRKLIVLRDFARRNKKSLGERYEQLMKKINMSVLEREMDLDAHIETLNLYYIIQGPTKQNGGQN